MKVLAVLVTLAACFSLATAPAEAGWKLDRARALINRVWNNPSGCRPTPPRRIEGFSCKPGAWEFRWITAPAQAGYAWTDSELPIIYLNTNAPIRRWDHFCPLALHEGGHLARQGHSTNPNSIMYPELLGSDPRCRRR